MCCSLEVMNLVIAAFVCVHYDHISLKSLLLSSGFIFKIKFLILIITELVILIG